MMEFVFSQLASRLPKYGRIFPLLRMLFEQGFR